MALTEQTKVDRVEVLEDGQLQIRKAKVIYEDGKEISRKFSRYVLDPARDTENLAGEDARVQDIANAIWTPELIAEREAALAPAPTDGVTRLVI